jgi:hypothetical protein
MTRLRFAPDHQEQEIRRLQMDLDHARRAIIRLMPESLRDVLYSYHQCTSRGQLYQWRDAVSDQIIEFATPLPRRSAYESERANCPLCGGSAQSFYETEQGFSLPVGLHRHLVGWGNTHQCDVTVAAFGLAHDWGHQEFHEAERRQEAEARAKVAERKATETLYQTGPNQEPELLGAQYQWRPVRDQKSLARAEERLEELGFKKTLQERVVSYTQEHPDAIVYADPREEGRIEFLVYRHPPPPRKSRRQPDFRPRPSFTLMDGWKHDLQKKYSDRLAQALLALTGARKSTDSSV